MDAPVEVLVEVGLKKTFISALDWPGWSRSGKGKDDALEQFRTYRERYNEVLKLSGLQPLPEAFDIRIVDEVQGGGATDFGVPDKVSDLDYEPLSKDDLERQIMVLRASWTYFDRISATVSAEMRKGPRGGGRDRDKIILHVLQSEQGYARYLLLKSPTIELGDGDTIAVHREAVEQALLEFGLSEDQAPRKWPVRYTIRRMAWHVLDHAWEMQDKTLN